MNLKTERLTVRNFTARDTAALHALYTDPEVMEYLGGVFGDRSETEDEMACCCLGEDAIRFAVVEPKSGKLVGEITYLIHEEPDMKGEAEIGWTLCRDEWNKGYATELTAALEQYAAKAGATALFFCCEEDQEIPARIAGKFGMENVGLSWGQATYRKTLG